MEDLPIGSEIVLKLLRRMGIPAKGVSLITENLVANGDNTALVVPRNV